MSYIADVHNWFSVHVSWLIENKEANTLMIQNWLIENKEGVGYAAILFCSLSYFPQIARIRKNKSSKDVSFLMFASWITGSCVWLTYGIMENLKPIILTNAINLSFRSWVLGTKVAMDYRNGRVNISALSRFFRPITSARRRFFRPITSALSRFFRPTK